MQRIKKLFLSAGVVLVFIAYSWQQRHDETGSGVILSPKKTSKRNSTSNSQTAAGSNNTTSKTTYKDGTYTGAAADAYYGYIQVQAVVSSGKIVDVKFLQYPSDQENSIFINQQAMPYLKQEAISAQSANVNIITGATDTSQAFIQSMTDALNQARQI